jgi:hypothetical protein
MVLAVPMTSAHATTGPTATLLGKARTAPNGPAPSECSLALTRRSAVFLDLTIVILRVVTGLRHGSDTL